MIISSIGTHKSGPDRAWMGNGNVDGGDLYGSVLMMMMAMLQSCGSAKTIGCEYGLCGESHAEHSCTGSDRRVTILS